MKTHATCAALSAPALAALLVLGGGGGGGGGDEPQAQTYDQCYEQCVSRSCAGAGGNSRLLCISSCANACQR